MAVDSGSFTPEQIERRRAIAQALLAPGKTRQITHWAEGLDELGKGAYGGHLMGQADKMDRERRAADLRAQNMQLFGDPAAAVPAALSNAGANPMGKLPAMGSRVYDQSEFNPLDAAVATPKELAAGVPAPSQYASLIGKAAVDNDLPPQLLAAQLKQESGFNPNAVSSAGASGISQFMPGTAREMGVNDPFNPEQAIPAGARYLRQNIDKFGGSVPLGLAAYNAGPGRVEKSGGDISRLPAETQGYVANISGAAQSPVAAALSQPAQGGGGILAGATPQQRAAIAAGMQASEGSPARAIAMSLMQNLAKPQQPTDDIREFEYGQRNPAFAKRQEDLKAAGRTQINNTVGGGSDKQVFDTMDESAKAARQTAVGMTGLREARSALQAGAITGAGANEILGLQKIGAALGLANSDKIVNTETFRAAIAPQVAAMLKSTVGTTNISNTDREFAEKAAGGNITLDGKSITRLLDIMERAGSAQLEGHMKRLEKVYPDAEKFARERALFGVDMPPPVAAPVPEQRPDVNALKKKYNLQ